MKAAEPNYTKQEMYTVTVKRLNQALKSEFYYEAIMLDYALVEDRFERLLTLFGVVNPGVNGIKVTKRARKPLRALLNLNSTAQFGIKNINTKITVIRKLTEIEDYDNAHFAYLHKLLIEDKSNISELMGSIDAWRDARNGLVHGLMNKVSCEIEPQLKELAEQGKLLFRTMDNLVGRMQKYKIREKFKID